MKVAIIGAGINGLYLAWKLSKSGHKVTVFEKKEKIGKEACSGLFSEKLFEFIPESRKLIQNKIDYTIIHFPKRTVKVVPRKKFFILSHAELDRLVAGLAEKEGAEIVLSHPVKSWPTEFPPIEMRGKKRAESSSHQGFDRVIGSDGFGSFVRKSLSLPNPKFRFTVQGFLRKENRSNYVETWAVKKGFLWKIPRGGETEYGIISTPKEAKGIFDDFLRRNNLSLERELASVVPQGFIVPENSLVTLCGDAAGLTKPWSGGGVVWGLMAASCLLKNFPDFIKYQKEVKSFFLPRVILSRIGTRAAYFLGFNLPWLVPKKVKIEGDFLF